MKTISILISYNWFPTAETYSHVSKENLSIEASLCLLVGRNLLFYTSRKYDEKSYTICECGYTFPKMNSPFVYLDINGVLFIYLDINGVLFIYLGINGVLLIDGKELFWIMHYTPTIIRHSEIRELKWCIHQIRTFWNSIYRVTRKRWVFRDDWTELVKSYFSIYLYMSVFTNLLNRRFNVKA